MKHSFTLLAVLVASSPMLLTSCQPDAAAHSSVSTSFAQTGQPPVPVFNITIAPDPPRDLPMGSDPKRLAEFAWAEFFALNWQASYPKNQIRDSADLTWNYRTGNTTLAVWETFAHRTELRPYSGAMKPFDSAPTYSFGKDISPANPNVNFGLFDNLDENNEIGSCDVYAHARDASSPMVLYQAKVNRVEYEYIRNNYPTNGQLLTATQATADSIKMYDAYYDPHAKRNQKYKGTCYCPPGVICLPCSGDVAQGGHGQGTIEIKSAWRQLTKADDPTRFLTRKVIYYHYKTVDNTSTVVYDNATFALIGLHIIHKTVNYPDFVFASWEQVDVDSATTEMGYRLLNKAGQEKEPLYSPYRRLHKITPIAKQATAAAHRKLKALNPTSVLQYYRLVGVQGTPTSNPATPNFFLANYVVESDTTLANFHGSGIGLPHDLGSNTLYQGKRLSAGGCQGCHGVGQLNVGTDFSFLLDQVGKPVFAPDIDKTQRDKLARYIRAITK